MNEKLCTYYREESLRCCVGFCKLKNLCIDGSCKVEGKIPDFFAERRATNYEFKRDYQELL